MKVLKAEHAGACYGVQRALELAREAVESREEASTLGPLIHNPLVVSQLENQGLTVATCPEEVKGGCVVIRSHGVTPEVRQSLIDAGLDVIDATCPHVARAQQGAAELADQGCRVIVVGEAGHPEVESLLAYAGQSGMKVDAVLDPSDLPDDIYDPVGVVVQTTQTRRVLDEVVAELESRGLSPIVKDTICSATQKRQKAARELAGEVDAMVVIGGRNSSNTTRLAEICAESGTRTFHIESVRELLTNEFNPAGIVGVTAGASTPEDQIDEVVKWLEAL